MDNEQKRKQELLESMGLQDSRSTVLDDDDHDSKIPAEVDHDHDHDIQLQKAVFYSKQLSSRTSISHQGYSEDGDSASLKFPDLLKQKGICTSCKEKPHDFDEFQTWSRTQQLGEASWSVCLICGDDQPTGKMIRLSQCGHFFCEDCIRPYVGRRIQNNILELKCPDIKCNNILSAEQCCFYLPQKVADRWFEAIREAEVLQSPTCIQCPFEDCCGLFLDDGRGFLIRACPQCWRIFCMNCRVRWHLGLNCYQFQEFRRTQLWESIKNARIYILI